MNKVEKSCSTPLSWDWKSTPWYSTRISRVNHQLIWLIIIDDYQQDIHQVKHHHNNNLIIILIISWNNIFFIKIKTSTKNLTKKWKLNFLWLRTKLIHFSKLKQEWNILDDSDDVIVLFLENLNFYKKYKTKYSSIFKQNSFSWWCWRHHSIFWFYSKWKFYCFLLNFFETSKNKSDDVINLFLENLIKLTTNQFWVNWGIVLKIENYTPFLDNKKTNLNNRTFYKTRITNQTKRKWNF